MNAHENNPATVQELLSLWNKYDDERLSLTNEAVTSLTNEDFVRAEKIYLELIPFINNMLEFIKNNSAKDTSTKGPFFSKDDAAGLTSFMTTELTVCYANLGYVQIAICEPEVNTAVHNLLKGLELSRENNYIRNSLLECMNIVIHFHEDGVITLDKNSGTAEYMKLVNKGVEFLKTPATTIEKAAECYTQAVKILPSVAAGWHGLGLSLFTSDEAKAIDAWLECYKLDEGYDFDVLSSL